MGAAARGHGRALRRPARSNPNPTLTPGTRRRIAACFLVVFVCWDLKPVFYAIWGPLTFLMGYSDPRKPTNDLLHGARRPSQLRP